LIEIVTKGKKKMPKFEEKLKAKEIKELVEYVRASPRSPKIMFSLDNTVVRRKDKRSPAGTLSAGREQ